MDFGTNLTPIEVIKEVSFGGTYLGAYLEPCQIQMSMMELFYETS